MTLKYLRKLRPIINKAGKKHGIPVDEGEFIVGLFFESFKKAITDPRVPKVMLPLFGTFQPKIRYINRSLRASIRFFRNGGTTREYLNARIRRIWGVRNRLIQEANKKITWNEWRKQDKLEEYQELERQEREAKIRSKNAVWGADTNLEQSQGVFREIQAGVRSQRS